MAHAAFHPSLEGAQHGAKSLPQFLAFTKKSGAVGAQPSNFMLQNSKGLLGAKEIKAAFAKARLHLDGISAHCPFWVHTTAWTASPTLRPFLPPDLAGKSPEQIERWAEDYCLRLLDLCAELNVRILPMFWGIAFGWEMATGYPWGFWKTAEYDLLSEGQERFIKKTARLRKHARSLGIFLCHEIHGGTGAMCADDFNMLVSICDGDPCMAVNADPSHCWEGETWQTRFQKVSSRIYAAHVKNFVARPGLPVRMMEPDWQKRGVQFVDIPSGEINMTRYAEALIQSGYPRRYCEVTGSRTAPLVVEAESAFRDLDATSANGVEFVRDHLCFPVCAGTFEDGMGS
jgi:sugar phosphate isomerase/epimerase